MQFKVTIEYPGGQTLMDSGWDLVEWFHLAIDPSGRDAGLRAIYVEPLLPEDEYRG